MRCLQENLLQPDFRQACVLQLSMREVALQADWLEDRRVPTYCSDEIDALCPGEPVGLGPVHSAVGHLAFEKALCSQIPGLALQHGRWPPLQGL